MKPLLLKNLEFTEFGADCCFFDLSYEVGFKAYCRMETAHQSHDIQDYLAINDLSPDVYGEVVSVWIQSWEANPKGKAWGYFTEIVKVGRGGLDYDKFVEHRDQFRIQLRVFLGGNASDSWNHMDLHEKNVGWKNGRMVVIDHGCHFTYNFTSDDWKTKYQAWKEGSALCLTV